MRLAVIVVGLCLAANPAFAEVLNLEMPRKTLTAKEILERAESYQSDVKKQDNKVKLEYKVERISFQTEDEATQIIALLDKGTAASELPKKFHELPNWMQLDEFVKPFADSVAQLGKGEYSRVPVQSKNWWNVIRVVDIRPDPRSGPPSDKCEISDLGVVLAADLPCKKVFLRGEYVGFRLGLPYISKIPLQARSPRLSGNFGQLVYQYSYVAVAATERGQDLLSFWSDAARSAEPPVCVEDHCWKFRLLPEGSLAGAENVIEACPVLVLDKDVVPAAGEACEVISAEISGTTYLRAMLGQSLIHYDAGAPDLVVKLGQEWRNYRELEQKISSILKSPPLALQVRSVGASQSNLSVYGLAKYRASPFLKGWNEIVTIHVEGGPPWAESDTNAYGLIVSTSIYLSKQKTRRAEDYRLPEPAQQETYKRALSEILRRDLKLQSNDIENPN